MASVPDWERRGLRLMIALVLFGLAGHRIGIFAWFEDLVPAEYIDEYERSFLWAGVTAIVVNAPLIGRVTQTSTERFLGTLLGGAMGFGAYALGAKLFPRGTDDLYLVLMTAAAGGISCYLAVALNLDMTPRFFAMTFLLITWGAPDYESARIVAFLRTGGILLGVLMMQILAIIVLPRSATISAFRDLHKALHNMCDLSDLVWSCNELTTFDTAADPRSSPTPGVPGASIEPPTTTNGHMIQQPPKRQGFWTWLQNRHNRAARVASERQPLLDGHARDVESSPVFKSWQQWEGANAQQGGGPKPAGPSSVSGTAAQQDGGIKALSIEKRGQACEKALAGVYTALAACEENVKLSTAEIYLWHFWGHYIFLPGVPNLGRLYSPARGGGGRWHLHGPMVADMADSLRRLSRLLWNVHLSLSEELTPELKAAVEAIYGGDLLPQLARACGVALRCLADSFPEQAVQQDAAALERVARLLTEMQALSSEEHRRMVAQLTQGESGRQLARRTSMRPSTLMPSPSLPRGACTASMSARYGSGAVPALESPDSYHNSPQRASLPRSGANPLTAIQENRPTTTPTTSTTTNWLLPPRPPLPPAPCAVRSSSVTTSEPTPPTGNESACAGSASAEAQNAAVSGFSGLAASAMPDANPPDVMPGPAQGGAHSSLCGEVCTAMAHGSAGGLLFAATPDGHIAQVRWASFEFLVFELGDELEELFSTSSALMKSLPYPLKHT